MAHDEDRAKPATVFRTTQWSVVLAARDLTSPDARAALERLCRMYWRPLYCCVRRHGHSPATAQDYTQAFFAKLLEKNQIALVDPERGRFRTFLLRSLENFLHNLHARATATKRGGGREVISWDAHTAEENYAAQPPGEFSPEQLFERSWAATLLSATVTRLREEFSSSSRGELFDLLEPHLWGDDTSTPYATIAANLEMTVVAVKVTMHRLRQRYRDVLRDEIAQTVETDADVDDELFHLRRVLAR
jgi:RNA polymerase sigma factor (sigma-70 family)